MSTTETTDRMCLRCMDWTADPLGICTDCRNDGYCHEIEATNGKPTNETRPDDARP